MTAFVDATANVVKLSIDDVRSRLGETLLVTSLLERLDKVKAASGWSDRTWCEKAEISPTYVGTLKTRLRETGGAADARATEMMKLARAANVSLAWLIAGEGEMTDRFLPDSGKEALIRHSALDAGIPEDVISDWMVGAGQKGLLATPVDVALGEMRADIRRKKKEAMGIVADSSSHDLDELIDAPPTATKRPRRR